MPEPQAVFYAILVLNALFSSVVLCLAKPNRYTIAAVVVVALIWPFTNSVLEGHVLLSVDADSGITVSDLLTVAALGVAAAQAVRRTRGAA